MIRTFLGILCLVLSAPGLGAQELPVEKRADAYLQVARHTAEVVARLRTQVELRDLRFASGPPSEQAAIEYAASRLGATLGTMDELVSCGPTGLFPCSTVDGSKAGFHIKSANFSDSTGTIVVEMWAIWEPSGPRNARLFGRTDRLYLTSVGPRDSWRIVRWEVRTER